MKLNPKLPSAVYSLFFIQIFSTLAYAILYSTLDLFINQRLHLSALEANTILGGFIAFNYGLHLFSGVLGGRYLSFRNLFVLGMVFQIAGCLLLAEVNLIMLFWGMAFFLVGSGLNMTCMNMMITQLFQPDDKRREGVFLWNYSGMNLGFWVGFAFAGYLQLTENYHLLFLLSAVGNVLAIAITLLNRKKLRDLQTFLSRQSRSIRLKRGVLGVIIMSITVPVVHWLLEHASFSNKLVLLMGATMGCIMLYFAFSQEDRMARNKILAYILLALASLIFWALYQIAPIGLTTYAEYNVDRHVFGFLVSPQWILNINTTVIIIGGPLMTIFLVALRKKGISFSIPQQFTSAMLFIGGGFLILPLGIHFAEPNGLANFNWILASYILQSIGELLISPIGYAMVGQLAPLELGGLMMGTWMMVNGVAGVLSSYASNWALGNNVSNNPLITNKGYQHVFSLLGWVAFACGIVLFFMTPFLKRLINERSTSKHSIPA